MAPSEVMTTTTTTSTMEMQSSSASSQHPGKQEDRQRSTPVISNQSPPRSIERKLNDVDFDLDGRDINKPMQTEKSLSNGYHGNGTTNGHSKQSQEQQLCCDEINIPGSPKTVTTAMFSPLTEEPIVVERSTLQQLPNQQQQQRYNQDSNNTSFLSPFAITMANERISFMNKTSSSSNTTTTAVQKHDSQNINGWFFMFVDFLRFGNSFRLFFDSFRDILQGHPPQSLLFSLMGYHPSSSTTSKPFLLPSSTTSKPTRSRRRRPRQHNASPKHISGLPNHGQTCFLNTVLQALASLQPFLMYLDGIVQYQDDIRHAGILQSKMEEQTDDDLTFSRQLLDLLDGINNNSYEEEFDADDENNSHSQRRKYRMRQQQQQQQRRRLSLNPKQILRKIGESKSQFHSRSYASMEQQDAQELLSALLEIVIADVPELDVMAEQRFVDMHTASMNGSSSSRLYRSTANDLTGRGNAGFLLEDDDDGDGGHFMTCALANSGFLEGNDLTSTSFSTSTTVTTGTDFGNGLSLERNGTSVLSLSGLLSRIEEEQKQAAADANGDFLDSISLLKLQEHEKQPLLQSHQQDLLQEEKKQEHIESLAVSDPTSSYNPQNHKKYNSNGLGSVSGANSTQSQAMTTSLQSTISSTTPSPLSGWLGSTLQCTKCKHVRPIQNAPFLDIPLVPTSVPTYLANAYHTPTQPASPNRSVMPLCSLDECLADFTSVERIQDVECRFCTIQREIEQLDEESMMLRGAIETMEKRLSKKSGVDKNGVYEDTKYLRQDLAKVEKKMLEYKTMDPDEDDLSGTFDQSGIKSYEEDEMLFDSEQENQIKLERCTARKCLLLTRTPSVLCCHIQRRYYDPFTNRMEKCVQFVEFPQILDLSPYCAYGPRASAPWAAGQGIVGSQSLNGGKMLYKLRSIIEHRGNAYGGHYVSYRQDRVGKWYRISDSTVAHVSWQDVRTCQAYMLFYEAI